MQFPAEEKQQAAHDQRLGGGVLDMRSLRAWHLHGWMRFSCDIKGDVSVSWRMIILLYGWDQCRLNAHSVNPDSNWIESWSSIDRPLLQHKYKYLLGDQRALILGQHLMHSIRTQLDTLYSTQHVSSVWWWYTVGRSWVEWLPRPERSSDALFYSNTPEVRSW